MRVQLSSPHGSGRLGEWTCTRVKKIESDSWIISSEILSGFVRLVITGHSRRREVPTPIETGPRNVLASWLIHWALHFFGFIANQESSHEGDDHPFMMAITVEVWVYLCPHADASNGVPWTSLSDHLPLNTLPT